MLNKFLKKNRLSMDKIIDLDLRSLYIMQTPDRSYDHLLFRKGKLDRRIPNSPHAELAHLYYKHGRKWLLNNYKNTRYCYMREHYFGKPHGKMVTRCISVFDSIKTGYLRGKYKDCYIVVLNEPFCNLRYAMGESLDVPQMFAGHHRAGALVALDIYEVPVLIAKSECGFIENKHRGSDVTPAERAKLNKDGY